MTSEALARETRPAAMPQAEVAAALKQAYRALAARDLATAGRIANEVARQRPDNVHPWLILGIAALDRQDAAAANAFFSQALKVSPGHAEALSGLGKSLVLKADPFGAVALFERAIAAGSEDLSMVRLYKDLMCQMERQGAAAAVIEPVAARAGSASLWAMVGELYLDAERHGPALAAFDRAAEVAPDDLVAKMSQVKARLFRQDFAGTAALTGEILAEHPELDEMLSLRMSALRNLGRPEEALALLDAPFTSTIYYKRALGVAAHCHLDLGDSAAARIAFRNALHLTDEDGVWAAKAFGAFCFAEGDFAAGATPFSGRHPASNRAKLPYEISAPENLAGRKRLYLMEEQGVGDQLALLPLVRLAPLADGCTVTFLGEPRMEAVLAGNRLGLRFRAEAGFDPKAEEVLRGEVVFLGDLTRYLPARDPATPLGGYLRPDDAQVAATRARYARLSGGRPTIGVAWRTGDRITGFQRSVDLSALAAHLPAGAFVVSLQYGNVAEDIAAAAALRPDVTFHTDPEVDQLADLGAFLAQISALDRVVTIDNTTAHAAGAIGHPDAHLLLPAGAECMWYWQRSGTTDPWYGVLHLHRQTAPRDWAGPLAGIAALPPVRAAAPDPAG